MEQGYRKQDGPTEIGALNGAKISILVSRILLKKALAFEATRIEDFRKGKSSRGLGIMGR